MYSILKIQTLSYGHVNAIVVAFPWRTHDSGVLWKTGRELLQPSFTLGAAATAEKKYDQYIFSLLHHENVNPEISL